MSWYETLTKAERIVFWLFVAIFTLGLIKMMYWIIRYSIIPHLQGFQVVTVHRIFQSDGIRYVWADVQTCCGTSRILFEARINGYYNTELDEMVDKNSDIKLGEAIRKYQAQDAQ